MKIDFEPNSLLDSFKAESLAEFEQYLVSTGDISHPFEKDYINHLRATHGGRPLQKYFSTRAGEEFSVHRFLDFSPDGDYRVQTVWDRLDEALKEELIPFAQLEFGDYVCFEHSTSPPRIVVWMHETRQVHPVADSFSEFLELLSAKDP